MERYSTNKRYKNDSTRRAESSGGGHEPSEIITSMNFRDIASNIDRTPSISPSTLRTINGGAAGGGQTFNNLFYHNSFG
jgi:hypothetical protein